MHNFLLALQRSPDLALLCATAGLCLIALELNRPGLIFPGAVGLLLALLGAAALGHYSLTPWALGVVVLAAVTLAFNLYRVLPALVLAASTLGLMLGFQHLLASPASHRPAYPATALGCGGLLGGLAAVLSRIAHRARRAKAVH